ncbi:DUF2460 domain-containing protein [Brevundimonas sp.]|uniref:DUF2460 domain-containing protein n=1 Tax=Brevundimonas sp. TaxID=1871086 RepID=UPI00262C82ED|nr:DUF2460 domain-containing protein [Brevundimonas sp.]
MSFHEVSLPARLAFGSTGGVERRTEVVTLGSGFERRSTPWAQGRRRWLIGASLRSLADMAELVAFFEARRGRLYGFRFRDFMDFRSGAPGAMPAATDQAIGTGDGTTTQFQLVKGERVIAKPVAGSVIVAVDGAPVEAEAEAATGLVTLNVAPAEGAVVTAGFLFDVPVRFDADRIDVTLESFDAGRMAAVPLVEVRV